MAHYSGDSGSVSGARRKKFDIDLRAYLHVRDCEDAHADIAHVDANCVEASSVRENTHRSVEQLSFLAATIGLGGESGKHSGKWLNPR
jgi:hypothetical protein